MATLDLAYMTLTSGRKIMNRGAGRILGISPELRVSWGYNSGFSVGYTESGDDAPPLTGEERREIADMMIGLWTAWIYVKEPE